MLRVIPSVVVLTGCLMCGCAPTTTGDSAACSEANSGSQADVTAAPIRAPQLSYPVRAVYDAANGDKRRIWILTPAEEAALQDVLLRALWETDPWIGEARIVGRASGGELQWGAGEQRQWIAVYDLDGNPMLDWEGPSIGRFVAFSAEAVSRVGEIMRSHRE